MLQMRLKGVMVPLDNGFASLDKRMMPEFLFLVL